MFHLHVNIQDTANQIGKAADIIKNDVLTGVEQISIGARDFIIYTVQESYKAHDYYRTSYLGNPQNEAPNIKWSKLGSGMWQVEVDEKARWLEEGRASMFMEWLLKNAKTAKDGSKYKVIPMSILKGAGKPPGWKPHNTPLADLASKVLKDEGINLKKLDRDIDNKPITTSKLIDTSKYAETADRSLFSMPRDAETAKRIGLKPHSGIFMLEGLRVNQTPNLSAKHHVSKEAMTFRVISSKHQAEGRWFYPEIKALNAVGQAEEWARQQMKLLEDSIKQKFENNT
jgi:hypothetical protein